jgi:hypothetical protein
MDKNMLKIYKYRVKNLNILKRYDFDKRYVCNNKGTVFLIKEEKEDHYMCVKIKPFINRDGYVEYVLTYGDGSKKHVQAQILTAGLYIKNVGKDCKLDVNHLDRNKLNNGVKNLKYDTHSDNIKHSHKDPNRLPWGNKNNNS